MAEIINNNNIITIIKYTRIPSLIKAQNKYRLNNNEKMNKIANNWYNKNKDNPEFKEKRKLFYLKTKEKKQNELNE
jgi:hypothetical protein